jgi:hypothetical protein
MEFGEAYLNWTFVSSETHEDTTLLKAYSDTNILGDVLCVWIEKTTWEKEEGRTYDEAYALAVVSQNELYTIKISIREDKQEFEELKASETKVAAYNLMQHDSPVVFPFKTQVFLTMLGHICWRI